MITVVEPHADDAWLSLGQHLLGWRERNLAVEILTVYGNPTRLREARSYAAYVGAIHRSLGVPEGDLGLAGEWMTELPSAARVVLASLTGRVIGPLGLQHPEHRAVAAALPQAQRYIEQPYASKQSCCEELNERLDGRAVVSFRTRSAHANAAASIFKTQSQFWRFNRERMIGATELIVT